MTDRRSFLRALVAAAAGAVLAGCDRISQSSWGPALLGKAEGLTRRVQALASPSRALAREYAESDISPWFKPNGNTMPQDPAYRALLANGFRDYRLQVDGLVERPQAFALDALREVAARTQITRHDCVEGWSAIGKWQGVPLAALLDRVGVRSGAQYVVFHCFDRFGADPYYESLDLAEARHPQTILAWALNDKPLPVANGAPLRLRVERQLGYKQAKYLRRIELVERLEGIAGGRGGYWEDRGYEWYAGI